MNDKRWGCDCGWATSYDSQDQDSWVLAMERYDAHRETHLFASQIYNFGADKAYAFDYASFERRVLAIFYAAPLFSVKTGVPSPGIEDGDELRAVVEAELITWELGRPRGCGCGRHL